MPRPILSDSAVSVYTRGEYGYGKLVEHLDCDKYLRLSKINIYIENPYMTLYSKLLEALKSPVLLFPSLINH
jgi:hypothetical protein